MRRSMKLKALPVIERESSSELREVLSCVSGDEAENETNGTSFQKKSIEREISLCVSGDKNIHID